MSIEREEKLIRAFLEKPGAVLYGNLRNLDARVARVKADLEAANLEVYALRRSKAGERFISNNTTFEVWAKSGDCYGPRLIVRTRRVPTATGRLTVAKPNIQDIPRKKVVTPTTFEKRFYNESVITYETAPGQGFEVYFRREDREVEILHISDTGEFTYKAAAHPDDQYDEQFGFELAAARLWDVELGVDISDFIIFRAYVWGVKGWGVLDLAKFENGERWPHRVDTLLAASKDPSFRQRGWRQVWNHLLLDVKTTSPKTETPFEIITRYKETTERGKIDRKTALQLWKDLKDAGYTPVDVRDARSGDKFYWSGLCRDVFKIENEGWTGDPVLILAKTEAETPVTPAPEPTQEDRWIDQESGVPIQTVKGGFTFGGKRLIVEPITPVPSSADERALNFIRKELREEGNARFVSKAEGLLKQYREWGFEPVDYRKVRVGEYYGSAYTGYPPEKRTERESYLNFLIFAKVGEAVKKLYFGTGR